MCPIKLLLAGKWKSKIFLILLLNLMVSIKMICFTFGTGLITMLHVHAVYIAGKSSFSVPNGLVNQGGP